MSKTTVTSLALLLGLAVGGVVAYVALPVTVADSLPPLDVSTGSAPATDEAALRVERAPAAPTVDGAGGATAPAAGASSEDFAAAEALNRELKAELAALRARPRPQPEVIVSDNPPTFSFGIPEDAPAFAGADWKKLGGHATRLTALLRELREALARGESPSSAATSSIQRENMPLALFTMQLAGDVEDMTPNGAFVHPAVTANLARGMLEEAGQPLTADQERALDALGSSAAANIERLIAGLSATTPEIGRTAQITDARLQFVDALRSVLTPEQDALLFPPETAGRLKLDLLSPALVYVTAAPVEARSRDELATNLVTRVLSLASTPREDVSAFRWIGERWVDAVPGVLEPLDMGNTDIYFPHVDLCQSRAHAEAAAIRRLVESGSFDEDEVAKLRAVNGLLYPYLR